jgi:thymidylate synthase (FAD)
MILVNPSYEILECPRDVLTRIERAARTCYKSEDRITQGSAEALVKRLVKSGHWPMIEFGGDIVVRFVSNRGFTHELVRHRLASYAQESTRYCNYSKGKFGGDITCVVPPTGLNDEQEELYTEALHRAGRNYMMLIEHDVPAQLAREVLPIGLKAEINIKANLVEWRHIFRMRCSKRAHPRMQELMIPLLKDVHDRIPIIFDDLYVEYTDRDEAPND